MSRETTSPEVQRNFRTHARRCVCDSAVYSGFLTLNLLNNCHFNFKSVSFIAKMSPAGDCCRENIDKVNQQVSVMRKEIKNLRCVYAACNDLFKINCAPKLWHSVLPNKS